MYFWTGNWFCIGEKFHSGMEFLLEHILYCCNCNLVKKITFDTKIQGLPGLGPADTVVSAVAAITSRFTRLHVAIPPCIIPNTTLYSFSKI